jgi:hypothetical protein
VIGKDATANCHLGWVHSDVFQQVFHSMRITCLKLPVAGSTDIDFWVSTDSGISENDPISSEANSKLILDNGGVWVAGMVKEITVFPLNLNASYYLYMVNGGSTSNNTYTDGQFLIEIKSKRRLTPGSDFLNANTIYHSWIESDYDDKKVKTNILIDLTGLVSEATHYDIIGDNGSDFSYIAQMKYEYTGIIYKARISCLETPAGGEPDIDVYQATSGSGTEGADVRMLFGATQLVDTNTDWAAGVTKVFATNPSDNNYLYLTVGTSASPEGSTYTGGKFLIEFYGTKISDVPNMTSIVSSYDADFGSGFKMMTGSTTGSYIELCSQEASYVCASGRKWWIETQFKLDDHDATEFFFGIAEPACGSVDLMDISSAFLRGAGKDRVGFTKATHNVDAIYATSTKNTNGQEGIALTTSLKYEVDNNILTLGIYWDGSTKVYFYGNARATASSIANMELLYTHTVSGSNVVPTDSNNYLRLFINNVSATKTCTINYIRGKMQLAGATTLYTY